MFILCGSEKFIISLAVYDIRLPALQNGPLPLPSSSKTANRLYLQCESQCIYYALPSRRCVQKRAPVTPPKNNPSTETPQTIFTNRGVSRRHQCG